MIQLPCTWFVMFLVSLDIIDQKVSLFILFLFLCLMSYFSAARLLERVEKQLASLVEMSLFEPEFAGKLGLLICKNLRIMVVRALRNTPRNEKNTPKLHIFAHMFGAIISRTYLRMRHLHHCLIKRRETLPALKIRSCARYGFLEHLGTRHLSLIIWKEYESVYIELLLLTMGNFDNFRAAVHPDTDATNISRQVFIVSLLSFI